MYNQVVVQSSNQTRFKTKRKLALRALMFNKRYVRMRQSNWQLTFSPASGQNNEGWSHQSLGVENRVSDLFTLLYTCREWVANSAGYRSSFWIYIPQKGFLNQHRELDWIWWTQEESIARAAGCYSKGSLKVSWESTKQGYSGGEGISTY